MIDKMPPEPYHKPWERPKLYQKRSKIPTIKPKDAPRTAARSAKSKKHENLTLYNWLTVYAFIDQHPRMTQGDIVKHFSSKSIA
jgi:hypothetical protein